ncbi:MAG: hypothetical protein ACOYZ8_17465 [Chloroflexota bacterium]
MKPQRVLLLGFILVFSGFVVPLLMVMRVIPPGFVLGFLSFAASVSGLFLGLIGAASWVQTRRR